MLRCGRTWLRLIGSFLSYNIWFHFGRQFQFEDNKSTTTIKRFGIIDNIIKRRAGLLPCREWVGGGVVRRQSGGLPSGRTGTNGSSGSALGVRCGWAANGPFRQSSPALAILLRPTWSSSPLPILCKTTGTTSRTTPGAWVWAAGRSLEGPLSPAIRPPCNRCFLRASAKREKLLIHSHIGHMGITKNSKKKKKKRANSARRMSNFG